MSDSDIVQDFLVESYENLDRLDREPVGLEKNPDDREALAPELEFDEQPRKRDEIIARRAQHADQHPHSLGIQAVVSAAMIEHYHPGRFGDWCSSAREAT